MSTKKATRRALLTSVMALVMCLVMLVGTTFAWFTDSVTSGVNTIKSGNLDMKVEYSLNGQEWAALDNATDLFQKGLWEPGHTELVALRITNAGSLALKYSISMNITADTQGVNKDGASFSLADYLTVGSLANATETDVATAFGSRDAAIAWTEAAFKAANVFGQDVAMNAGDVQYALVKVYMPTTVGNEANAISPEKAPAIEFGLNIYAAQQTKESDSFDEKYDESAEYPTQFAQGLLKGSGEVTLPSDVTVTDGTSSAVNRIADDAVVNFNDKKIVLDLPDATGSTVNWTGVRVAKGTVVFNADANGGVQTAPNGELYAVTVGTTSSSADLTINGGTYIGGTTAVQITQGKLTINGGFFKAYIDGDDEYNANPAYLINCIDANYQSGAAQVEIKGGTFVNFDPSNNAAEGANTNFVAAGYKVVSAAQTNGDVWYTVVAE